jgi:formylglycine-generating enzyme required for sulfatase activity
MEVTLAAYKRFLVATGGLLPGPRGPAHDPGWDRDALPMTRIPWAEASRYCRWVGGRLPTEDEWQYGASGGGSGPYPWGAQAPVCAEGAAIGARFDDRRSCPLAGPAPVGTFAANGFGLFDMAGNVWEWCDDRWSGMPFGGYQGRRRVVRGGGWADDASRLRVDARGWHPEGEGSVVVGFRCAVEDLQISGRAP